MLMIRLMLNCQVKSVKLHLISNLTIKASYIQLINTPNFVLNILNTPIKFKKFIYKVTNYIKKKL